MPMPKPDPEVEVKTSLRVRVGAWRMLRAQALLEGRPTGDVLAEAVAAYVKRKGGKT